MSDRPRQPSITIQQGHCFRAEGATGTVREQEFAYRLSEELDDVFRFFGWKVNIIGADYGGPYPSADIFVALHCDGSINGGAHGASVGFPIETAVESARYASLWKVCHQETAGYEWGFRRDNYTRGLKRYYGFGQGGHFRVELVVEHFFATNAAEQLWAFSPGTIRKMALAHAQTAGDYLNYVAALGVPEAPDPNDVLSPNELGDLLATLHGAEPHNYPPAYFGDGRVSTRAIQAWQGVIGTRADGVWGPKSQAAHDHFMHELQAYLDGLVTQGLLASAS